MSAIEETFQKNKKVLIPFITAGDPSLEETKNLIRSIAENGGDILELGVPFSASLADGPVIQDSFLRALNNKTNIYKIFDLCSEVREEGVTIPLVLMLSCNIILKVGNENFFKKAKESGVNGVIIPDAPLGETEEFMRVAKENAIDVILLAAPTTNGERLNEIVNATEGFLYYISSVGITGERSSFANKLKEEVAGIKSKSNIPVAVGFGISKPEHASEMSAFSDGVVIGSALVRLIHESSDGERIENVAKFIASIKVAMTSS